MNTHPPSARLHPLTDKPCRFGKTDSQELTTDEVVICLEQELRRPQAEKRLLEDPVPESGDLTPSPLAFQGPESTPSGDLMTDQSSAVEVLEPGTQVVTNPELCTVVRQPPRTQASQSSSGGNSLDPSDDSRTPDTVERGPSWRNAKT